MDDRYSSWHLLLRGEPAPTHEIEPSAGFWRSKPKGSQEYVGIAIWYEGDKPVAMRGHEIVRVDRVWPFCGKNPISEEMYREWKATGVWSDDHPIPTAPLRSHNEPVDEIEIFKDQIESAKAGAGFYVEIETDEACAKAQSLRSRLLELGREADKKRETLKKPYFEAGKAIDKVWQPLIRDAKETADAIARAMSAYQTGLATTAAIARRKAQEEVSAGVGLLPTDAALQAEPPAPRVQVKGAYGKAASVRPVFVAQVDNQDAVYMAFRDHQEVKTLLQKLAQRSVDAGEKIDGVTVVEMRKVV